MPERAPEGDVIFVDGSAMVNTTPPRTSKMYEDYAREDILPKIKFYGATYKRVDVVFDVYGKYTLKGEARMRRGQGMRRRAGIDVSEKVQLYNHAFLRYNGMAKMSTTKPTPVVVVKEKETPATTDIMGEIVTTLHKALQQKGHQVVSRIKTTQWKDRGELLHGGVVLPGSNAVYIVQDLRLKRKTSDPIG